MALIGFMSTRSIIITCCMKVLASKAHEGPQALRSVGRRTCGWRCFHSRRRRRCRTCTTSRRAQCRLLHTPTPNNRGREGLTSDTGSRLGSVVSRSSGSTCACQCCFQDSLRRLGCHAYATIRRAQCRLLHTPPWSSRARAGLLTGAGMPQDRYWATKARTLAASSCTLGWTGWRTAGASPASHSPLSPFLFPHLSPLSPLSPHLFSPPLSPALSSCMSSPGDLFIHTDGCKQ